MKAIAALAKAAEAATDPDQIRQAARQRADQLAERAQLRGQELLEAARRQAQRLREDAASQRKELLAQAEVDVQAAAERWDAAYQAACAADWTVDQLREVGYEPPPRPRRRASRRRRTSPDAAPAATVDTADSAEPTEHPASVPA